MVHLHGKIQFIVMVLLKKIIAKSLELDQKDPNFIEKTCGGLKLVDNDPMIQTAKYQHIEFYSYE